MFLRRHEQASHAKTKGQIHDGTDHDCPNTEPQQAASYNGFFSGPHLGRFRRLNVGVRA